MPQMVRVTPKTHRDLTTLAAQTKSSLQATLQRAIENERRRVLIARANAGYAELRANKKAWRAWKRELEQMDATLADGI